MMLVSVHEGAMALMRIGRVGRRWQVRERMSPRTACLVVAGGVVSNNDDKDRRE